MDRSIRKLAEWGHLVGPVSSVNGTYESFLKSREIRPVEKGFKPLWIPDFLFGFQSHVTDWAIRLGRAAMFEDTGLGKSIQELVWAENVLRKTNGNVLLLCPLAVSTQMVEEGEKFGIEVRRTQDGTVHRGINVTNYERLKNYDPSDFQAVIADESSILKNFDGKTRRRITKFMRHIPYRLLATATPAPNDFMELGNSSEALGEMTRNQMLSMFFVNDGETTSQWNLKGHAKRNFWRWMASWARAIRRPSDLGFDDDGFILPPLNVQRHLIDVGRPRGAGFFYVAKTMSEQRQERRRTIQERCEAIVDLVPNRRPFVVWAHLNDEADLCQKLIHGAVQVKGSQSDDEKEELLDAFKHGEFRILVTKPRIACFGLNWQHCADTACFPSHSHEQFYQLVRRFWRFGQKRPVNCHVVASQGEQLVLENMLRKERQSNEMFDGVLREMNAAVERRQTEYSSSKIKVPEWIT